MITIAPALMERPEVHYVAKAKSVTIAEFGKAIPESLDDVMAWLGGQGIDTTGAPLIRYRVIDMERELQVEIGWPVAEAVDAAVASEAGLVADTLPAGVYGATTFRGDENGIAGNKALIEWASENGIEWDNWDVFGGDAFRSRVEFLLTGPDDDPDSSTWETEVAILVKPV